MLTLNGIVKEYNSGDETVHALRGVSLHFRPHEFVAILGPSGCGKTTLLNIIGGLDHYTEGDLVICGTSTKQYRDKDWDTYRNHRVGFIFQSYNLIPHQSVLSNVELALTLSGVSRAERRARASAALESVGLGDQKRKKPNQMSGGQMQRVAIARALVNDPDIVLADEPTGALDTATSVQIMEILRGISDRKLIVMVTHNPDLAEQYATRIIRVRDGEVIDDTNPYDGVSEELTKIPGEAGTAVSVPEGTDGCGAAATEGAAGNTAMTESAARAESAARKKTRGGAKRGKRAKTSMSFLTALSLSLNNLMTKKTRTFLTAFAGSIGIIGIALILALSNGIQLFINKVQEDTLSSYPIQIEESSVDLNSMLSAFSGSSSDDIETEDGYIYSDDQLAGMANAMLSGYQENDLAAFRAYLQSDKSSIADHAVIQYRYGVAPQVYINRDGKYWGVNPSSVYASFLAMMGMDTNSMSASVWSEMIDSPELLNNQYTVLEGRWPEAYNEVVLVTDKNHRLSDMTLYALGIKDPREFSSLFDPDSAGKADTEPEKYTYEQLMDLKYRMVISADYYSPNGDGTYRDLRKSESALANLLDSDRAIDLKIVGIIAANPDAAATSINGAIGYTSALTDFVIEQALSKDAEGNYVYEVVGQQLANPKVDVLTGREFYEEDDSTDEEKTAKLLTRLGIAETPVEGVAPATASELAGQYDENIEQITFSKLFAQKMMQVGAAYPMGGDDEATMTSANAMRDELERMLTGSSSLINRLVRQYPELANGNVTAEGFLNYIDSILANGEKTAAERYQTVAAFLATLKVYEGDSYDTALENAKRDALNMTLSEKADAYRSFAGSAATDPSRGASLWDTWLKTGCSTSTYKKNLRLLGIADTESPTAIYLYPKSFEAKDLISAEIEAYNSDHPDGKITYTDYIGIMLSSVSTILQVITYVLVAFVGISLVVSSIMIGIITYISVLERIKEIGILRAIGASKRNVSQVFLAETLIVGFIAGLMGILVTLVLCIPANIAIRALSGFRNISASLPIAGAFILIGISMLLTLVAGLIPARIAAKKEPVEALRSE